MKLFGPTGCTSASVAGVAYEQGEDGLFDVPEAHAADLIPHGFRPALGGDDYEAAERASLAAIEAERARDEVLALNERAIASAGEAKVLAEQAEQAATAEAKALAEQAATAADEAATAAAKALEIATAKETAAAGAREAAKNAKAARR